MRNRLPTRTLMFLGAMYAALTLGAAAAQAAPQSHVNWSETASPGIIEGAPRADQVLLTGSKRHTCQALHVTFDAGGQAQSASLLLRRAGRPDVRVDTETDTRGTLDAALRPGKAWQLAASTPSVSIDVEATGWASCRNTKGLDNLRRSGR
jgi:hypothetical protein